MVESRLATRGPDEGRPRFLCLVLLLCWLSQSAGGAAQVADTLATLADEPVPEELTELLQELALAEQEPSRDELQRWLEEARAGREDGSGWSTRWIAQEDGESGHRLTGRFQGRRDALLGLGRGWSGVEARFRLRMDDEDDGQPTGGLALGTDNNGLVLGRLNMRSGGGLLLGGSGGRSGLVPDATWGRLGTGLSPWSGQPDDGTITGAAARLRWGGSRLLVARGTTGEDEGDGEERPAVLALSASGQHETCHLGCEYLTMGPAQGAGIWAAGGAGSRSPWRWSAQTAFWWQPQNGRSESWQLVAGWSVGKRLNLQWTGAMQRGAPASPLARRSAFLRGEVGRSWAVRARWRPPGGGTWWAMLHRVEYGDSPVQPDEKLQLRGEVLGHWNLGNKRRLEVRLALRSQDSRVRSPRYPWASPVRLQDWTQGKGRLRLSGQREGLRWSVGAGFLSLNRAESGGTRCLVSGRLDHQGSVWSWRLGHGLAWGEPVDLLGAVNPLPGLVLPRHWGSWQSETQASLGVRRGHWQVTAAVAWRGARSGAGLQDSRQAWLALERRN